MALRAEVLAARLRAADGRGYKAYQSLRGEYELLGFTLFVDHVQADPFAPPSRMRVRVPREQARFPSDLYATHARAAALADFLTRALGASVRRHAPGRRGRSDFHVDEPGQEVLERTSCLVGEDLVEARLSVDLPAAGRTCLGMQAQTLLLNALPQVVRASLFHPALDAAALRRHVAVVEDQQALRVQLAERGLVAFVGEGAVLPRASGVSELPLRGRQVVGFTAPPELAVELDTPNRGRVVGMGVPAGVTLIVGGGYHGKSTLLSAIARGVYDHISGDGRDYCVTRADAVKIRAEDGRRVERVDISPFISNLPFGRDTREFSSDNASGSTSQAANIVEALECGSRVLLMDEDTCATNFMVRDARMQRLVPKEREPITPLVDQARNLYREHGVSIVLVMGGSSDYFEAADTVIAMDTYSPRVVTGPAKELARELASGRTDESGGAFGPLSTRVPLPESVDHFHEGRERVAARDRFTVSFGSETIDLRALEQLVDTSQTRALARMLSHAVERRYVDGRAPLCQVVERVFADVRAGGLDALSPFPPGEHPGDLALPRPLEVAAAFNRLRSLRVRPREGAG